MKKLFLATIATAALAIAPAVKASSIPYGTFGFVPSGSTITYTGTSLGSATTVTLSTINFVNGPSVPTTYLGQPNIFNGIAGSSIAIAPLTLSVSNINGAPVTYNISDYLTWSFSGDTYAFDLVSGTWASSGGGALNFTGLGYFTDGNGTYNTQLNPAAITYGLTIGTGSNINYSATFEVPPGFVPEPSSLVLLGTGLLGAALLLFRRRRTTKGAHTA